MSRRWALLERVDAPDVNAPDRDFMVRYRLVQTPWFGIYLHRLNTPDRRDTLHDHPWPFISIVLRGGYKEWLGTPSPDGGLRVCCSGRSWRAGSVRWMRKTDAHTIYELLRVPTWTLLLVGHRRPEPSWGYWENGEWVPHDEHPHAAEFAAAMAARHGTRHESAGSAGHSAGWWPSAYSRSSSHGPPGRSDPPDEGCGWPNYPQRHNAHQHP